VKSPSFPDILAAEGRLRGLIHKTPVITCSAINELAGAELFFKCENLQKVGAFKYRGASNAIRLLPEDQARKGVATHSSGNHAQALALAAKTLGVPATIVMPSNAPKVKVQAVRGYGAEIVFCEPTLQAREEELARVITATGATLIHPYDNPDIIAGQGTAALELLAQAPGLEGLFAPVGGGGLLSGTVLAAKGHAPTTPVYGAEPELADDAYWSLKSGRLMPPKPAITIADGLRTALSELTFSVLHGAVKGIYTVSEEAILQAMRLLMERTKMVVEPSGAVALAAVLAHKDEFAGKRLGIIISGGNVDLANPNIMSVFSATALEEV
jgi:threonine dehydratase